MKKSLIRSALCLLLALAFLPLGISFAAGKKYSNELELYDSVFDRWIYVPSTLPEGAEPVEIREAVRIYKSVWTGETGTDIRNPQEAETATLTFVSGDEGLKDAVSLEVEPAQVGENGEPVAAQRVFICINNDAITAPGSAVFEIAAESENFVFKKKKVTLNALSWEEHPLVTLNEDIPEATLDIGETVDVEYVRNRVLKSANFDKILGALSMEKTRTGKTGLRFSETDALEYDDNGNRKVVKGGSWDVTWTYEFANVRLSAVVPMSARWYQIQGPATVRPGESAQYTVNDTEEGSGRTFAWSLEGGEGITLDEETGTVTVAADVQSSSFVLTATPSDGLPAISIRGDAGVGVLAGIEFEPEENSAVGFSFIIPADNDRFNSGSLQTGGAYWKTKDTTAPSSTALDYYVYGASEEFYEDPDLAKEYLARSINMNQNGITVLTDEYIEPEEGHPARIIILRVDKTTEGYSYSMGALFYVRNNRMMRFRLYSEPQNGTSWEDLPKVEKEDLLTIAKGIRYDPAHAPISVLDAQITLAAKEGTTVVTAGKKLNFLATFANPKKVNKQAKNDTLNWTVTGADGAEAPAGVSISNKGVLSTGKTDVVLNVEVKAESPVFHVSTVIPVTILPVVKKVSVEPAELFFYTGTDTPQEVKAVLDPDTVPPLGITWTPAKKDLLEITPDEENGTASIKPLAAGKTTVAVKEPGGKNAKLTVNVVDPVETLELAVSGKTTPGSTVTVKETIAPKQAGNKTVEWSLDVGEDIATVSKGKVKISKEAPAGTVITVTCTALGAPEPITATIQIEVTEK